MRIQLKFFANIRKYHPTGNDEDFLEYPEGMTPGGVVSRLAIPPELAKIIFVNGMKADRSTLLKDGDRLGIFPPLAGG